MIWIPQILSLKRKIPEAQRRAKNSFACLPRAQPLNFDFCLESLVSRELAHAHRGAPLYLLTQDRTFMWNPVREGDLQGLLSQLTPSTLGYPEDTTAQVKDGYLLHLILHNSTLLSSSLEERGSTNHFLELLSIKLEVAKLADCFVSPACKKPWIWSPALHKPDTVGRCP